VSDQKPLKEEQETLILSREERFPYNNDDSYGAQER
jgi:hypothetical protein